MELVVQHKLDGQKRQKSTLVSGGKKGGKSVNEPAKVVELLRSPSLSLTLSPSLALSPHPSMGCAQSDRRQ